MKRLLLLFWIAGLSSTLMHGIPAAQARGGCERSGIVTGTITFVDLVCDTLLFVPRLVISRLTGHGHGYPSQRGRHHYNDNSHSDREDYGKKGRRGRHGRGRR